MAGLENVATRGDSKFVPTTVYVQFVALPGITPSASQLAVTLMIVGLETGRYVQLGPVAWRPESVLVTTTGPAKGTHCRLAVGTAPLSTTIWVPDTDCTWADQPASVTVTGATNPCPTIVTWVPPMSGPRLGASEEMNIAWPYWNGSVFCETLPEAMFVTETWTVVGVPGWLAVMEGEVHTTWL